MTGPRCIRLAAAALAVGAALPPSATVACSYGIQPPQIDALADALVGRIPFAGRLPVAP